MRLFGYEITRARPAASLTPPALAHGGWFPIIREPYTGAWQNNESLSAPSALAYFAVYGCVTLITTDIGKLHLRLVTSADDGTWSETTNPAYSPVLRKPNRYQTVHKFVEQWITSKLTAGNAYVLKQRDGRGVVTALYVLDPLKVTAEIPERMAPWINAGQDVELKVDAYQDRTFTGKVSRLSPAVNTSTRAFPFEALVPNKDAVLKPGTFARVHIESGKVDSVLTIPYAALQYRYGVNRVFVVTGDKLAIRELSVGERVGDRIEVMSGVKAGERVAITDVDSLADGAAVTVSK